MAAYYFNTPFPLFLILKKNKTLLLAPVWEYYPCWTFVTFASPNLTLN